MNQPVLKDGVEWVAVSAAGFIVAAFDDESKGLEYQRQRPYLRIFERTVRHKEVQN